MLLLSHSLSGTGKPYPKPKCTCAFPCGGTTAGCPSAPEAPKASALDVQVGGNHYSKLAIQPMEFAMTQMYDFAAASILKYVTRHRSKNGAEDIRKALHIMELRAEIARKHQLQPLLDSVVAVRKVSGLEWVVYGSTERVEAGARDIETYIFCNEIAGRDADAIRFLDTWFRNGSPYHISRVLKTKLEAILSEYGE